MNAYFVFFVIETYSPLIPLITFMIGRFKKTRWVNILLFYLIAYVPLSAYANFLARQIKNNIIIYLMIGTLSFFCFALIIEEFLHLKKFKIINRIVIGFTILFFLVNAIWWEGFKIFNSNSSALSNLILMVYCLYYYKLQLDNPQNVFIEKQSSFWIVSGIFIYCAGNFFLFTLYNSLTKEYEGFALYSWRIATILILIMNIFFAKGIQCSLKR